MEIFPDSAVLHLHVPGSRGLSVAEDSSSMHRMDDLGYFLGGHPAADFIPVLVRAEVRGVRVHEIQCQNCNDSADHPGRSAGSLPSRVQAAGHPQSRYALVNA